MARKAKKSEQPDRTDREPKYAACRRLEAEGRYSKFRIRVGFWRSKEGGRLDRDEAFYKALEEFPPN